MCESKRAKEGEQSNEMLDVSRGAGGVRWEEKGSSRGVTNRCMS